MNFAERLNKIKSNQNLKEFYSKNISGHISPYISATLVNTKISANQITLTMILFCAIACYFLQIGTLFSLLIGSFFLFLVNVVDTVDGEVARFKNTTSNLGDYLDRVCHYCTYTASIFFFSVGLYKIYNETFLLLIILGFFSLFFYFIDEIVRDLIISCNIVEYSSNRKEEKKKTTIENNFLKKIYNISFSNMAFFHLIGVMALMDIVIKYIFDEIFFSLSYFIIFSIFSLLRLCFRIKLIKNVYFK